MDNLSLVPSDIIEIFGILASLVVSIIAIVIAVKTLKQNSKMIEESTRPIVQIYPVYTNGVIYIIIKNFGQSEAIIDSITCDHKFVEEETLGDDLGVDIFEVIVGTSLCPGYSIKCPLVSHKVADVTFNFKIVYHSQQKTYSNTFSFTPHAASPFADMYPSSDTPEKALSNIAKELRDVVKSQL